MLKKLAVWFVVTTHLFAMHVAELNLNNSEVEVGVKLDIGQFIYSIDPDKTFFGVKFLKADEDNGDYTNPREMYELNFIVQQFLFSSKIFAGLGIKANYIANKDFLVAPLSAKLGYMFDMRLPVYLGAEYHYAPEMLSFMDAKGYKELRFDVDIELFKIALLNIGYRNIETKFKTGGYNTYNHAGYIGVKFKF